MFTQKQMTDAHREYINALLDDLFGRYVNAIAQARHKTPDEVRALIDDAPYGAAKAKQVGLIDDSMYRDELEKANQIVTWLQRVRNFYSGAGW
jgi:protease-4